MTIAFNELPPKLHFIGIGGAGMFPLVQILNGAGYEITGSDNSQSSNTDIEQKMGITVFFGHDAKQVGEAQMVIYTNAVGEENPELRYAKEKGIPVLERAELLGMVTQLYGRSICVAGSHGKTTTTAMASQFLIEAGLDPSVAVGGIVHSLGGNGRAGNSDIFVCEACEFKDSFLHLSPEVGIILNIDNDHLDYFKTMDNLIYSFRRFAQLCRLGVIVNGEDHHVKKAVEGLSVPITTFGLTDRCDYYPSEIVWNGVRDGSFNLCHQGKIRCKLHLSLPGTHNILNAIAAAVSALMMGAEPEALSKGLEDFKGVGRRFEILGEKEGITIADDFAHHPTEIAATIDAVMKLGYKKVYLVFQPHTFSRTAMLFEDFVQVLSKVDEVLIPDIYSAREVNSYGVSSEQLVEKLENAVSTPSFEDVFQYIQAHAQPGDLVMTMGGGDIYKVANLLWQQL